LIEQTQIIVVWSSIWKGWEWRANVALQWRNELCFFYIKNSPPKKRLKGNRSMKNKVQKRIS